MRKHPPGGSSLISALQRLRAFDRREKKGISCVAGVDEAGCGPLAGPVVAAAVILFRFRSLYKLNDSKQVSAAHREALFREITRNGLVGIGIVSEAQIDEINIFQASCLAMRRAVLNLTRTPDLLLIDGNRKVNLPLPQKSIIRGDQKSASIAAASIVAKVYRDAWMKSLDALHPGYNFSRHKGYCTQEHRELLKIHGPSPVHRKSFAPVQLCRAGVP